MFRSLRSMIRSLTRMSRKAARRAAKPPSRMMAFRKFGLQLEHLESRDVPAAFTPGNLVIYQVGDGSAALSNASTAAFLVEIQPSGTLAGNTIALPTADSGANQTLTNSGTASSEGALTLSGNGQFLTFGGYDVVPGTQFSGGSIVNSPTTGTGAVLRVIGRADSNGVIDTSTTTTAFSANNIRGAVSNDGTQFWAVGANSGVIYNTLGGSGAGTAVATNFTNLRVPAIANGQLYVSANTGTLRLGTVGTGLPTTTGQTITNLPGLPTASYQPYGYFFADLSAGVAGVDTLYIAADDTDTIRKYSLVAGTWTQTGEYTGQTDVRGLTGVVSGSNVTLYATRDNGTAADSVVTVTDTSGYNATANGTVSTIYTAPNTNVALRGIAPAPTSGAVVTQATLSYQVTTQNITEGTGAGSTVATVTVTRSGNTTSTVSVGYTTAPGSPNAATEGAGPTFNPGEDYLDATGTLTFGNGITQQSFQVTINRDSTIEPSEQIALTLNTPTVVAENGVTGATAVIGTGSSTLTINDDDATPPAAGSILLNEIFINPPGTDAPNEYFELINTTGAAISLDNVYLAVIEGDGTNAGIADFVVNLTGNTIPANSTFTIRGANNNLLAGVGGWGSLPSLIDTRLDATGQSVIENGANTYMLLFGSGAPAEATDYDATNDGTLEGLSAYTVLDVVGHQDSNAGIVYGGQLPRKAGATPDGMSRVAGTTAVGSAAQWFYGDMDSFLVNVYLPQTLPGNAPVGARMTPGAANTAPTSGHIRFAAGSFTGAEAGTITVTLQRVGGSTGAVDITLTTENLSTAFPGNQDFRAVAGSDYTALTGTVVSWADGDTADKTVPISVIDDGDIEGNETFQLVLSNPVNNTTATNPPTFQNPVALSGTNIQPAAVGVIAANDDAAVTAAGGLVINEVRIDQAGFDGGREFIELRNTTGAAISLTNLYLVSVEGDGAATPTTVTAAPVWTANGILTVNIPVGSPTATSEIDKFFVGDQVRLAGFSSTGAAINGDYIIQSVRRTTTTGSEVFSFSVAFPNDPGTITFAGATAQPTDAFKPGMFDYVFPLASGVSIPAGGYALLKSPGYTPAGTYVSINDARFDNFEGVLENGSNAFLLVYSPTALTQAVTPSGGFYELAADYDANNDGDLELPTGAVIIDGVGQNDSGGTGDIVYGQFLTSRYTDFPVAGFISRTGTGAFAAGDWVVGDGIGLPYFPPGWNPHPNDVLGYDYGNSSAPVGGALTPGGANFPAPAASTAGGFRFVATDVSVVENVATVTLSVERIDNTAGAATVTWTVTNGTAQNADWGDGLGGGNTGTVSFAAGESGIKTFTVAINNTAGAEGRETINVALTTTAGAIVGNPATVTIVDDDSAAPAAGSVLLNEVLFNPQSSDEPNEYFEVIGAASGSLQNLYFVSIEGDSDANEGTADYVFDLSSFLLGSNGLLVGRAPNSTLTFGAGTTQVFSTQFSESGGILENGSNTFAIIWSQTPLVAGTDYDADDNGTLELLPVGATIVDAVAVTDFGSTDRYYGVAPLVQPGSTPDAATRVAGNTTANSAAAWYNGDIFGNANTSLVYDQNISSASVGLNGPNAPLPGTPQAPNSTFTTSGLSWAAGVVTVNTATAHNFTVGRTVTIANVTPAGYNGVYVVTGTPTATSFTYALAADPGVATVNGSAVLSVYNGFAALPSGATLTPGSANYAIPATGVLSFAENTFTVTEGTGATTTLTVTVNRTGGTGNVDATVTLANYLTGKGYGDTATDVTGSLTATASFVGAATSATVTFTIVGDSIVEGNEIFGLALSNATNGAAIDSRSLLQPTTSAAFNAIRYGTTAVVLDNDTLAVLQSLVINEVKVDMAGDDGGFEYIEIRGTPGAVIPAGTYVLAIEGDQGSTFATNDAAQGVQWDKMGTVDYRFDIGGQTIGTNGILIIKGTVGGHAVAPGATVVGDVRLNDTANGGNDGGILENGSQSFVLVYSPTVVPAQATQAGGGAYELASDFDRDEDGTLEQLAADAVIIDRIGWSNPGNGDFAYSVYLSYPLFNFTPPAAATRLASNATAMDKDAWRYGELIFDLNTQLTYDPQAGYNNVGTNLTGRALTPGGVNFDTADTTAPTVVVTDNVSGGPIASGASVTYTLTFSEPVTGLELADITNGASGPAAGTFSNLTGGPTVYTVVFTSTGGLGGNLRLQINNQGAVIEDASGNDLVTPALDDTTIVVNAVPTSFQIASTTVLEGNAGFRLTFSAPYTLTASGTGGFNLYAGDPGNTLSLRDVQITGPGGAQFGVPNQTDSIRFNAVPSGATTLDLFLSGTTRLNAATGTTGVINTLAAGTWTVNLTGGTNNPAVTATTGGSALDGNGNGTVEATDNYSATVTVTAPASTVSVVAVGDLVAGPGQSFDIPLYINDATDVTSVDLGNGAGFPVIQGVTLPTWLTIDNTYGSGGFLINPAISGGSALYNAATGILTMSAATPFTTTPGTFYLGSFRARVAGLGNPGTAPVIGTKAPVDITVTAVSNATLQPRQFAGVDAFAAAAYIGDVSAGFGAYTGADVSGVQQLIGQQIRAFTQYKDLDPRLIADTTRDGALTGADVAAVQGRIVNVAGNPIPALPSGSSVGTPAVIDPRIFIDASGITAAPGQTSVYIPIRVTNTDPGPITITSTDVVVQFDPAVFNAATATISLTDGAANSPTIAAGGYSPAGALVGNGNGTAAWAFLGNVVNGNTLLATGSAAQGPTLAVGDTRTIYYLRLDVLANAGAGSTTLNLRAADQSGQTTTNMSNNQLQPLVLVPAVSNNVQLRANGFEDDVLSIQQAAGRIFVGTPGAPPTSTLGVNIPASPGQTLTIPVYYRAPAIPSTITSADVGLFFNPNLISISTTVGLGAVANGSLGTGLTPWSTLANVVPTNDPNVSAFLLTGSAAQGPTLGANDVNTLYFLTVTVNPTAPAGSIPLNILGEFQGFTTNAANNTLQAIALSPAPSNAAGDAQIDGSLLVSVQLNQPPFVSVPSSSLSQTANPVKALAGRGLVFTAGTPGGTITAGAVSVTDPNSNDANVRVTVSVPVGTVTLGSTAGVTVVSGDGTGTVVVEGAPAALTAALDGLTFRAPATFAGNVLMSITANDQSTNFGGALADTKFVNITVVRLFLNEVNINPPGTDGPNEWVEIRSSIPNYEIPTGTYLVNVEANGTTAGNGASAGAVNDLWNIGAMTQANRTTGTNGLLVLRQQGSPYAGAAADGATVVTSTGAGWSGANMFWATNNSGQTDTENAGASLLLLSVDAGGSAPGLATDIDAANDGTINGTGAAVYNSWAVNDSVAMLLGGATLPNYSYAATAYRPSGSAGTSLPGTTLVTGTGTWVPGYAARVGVSDGSGAADWVFSSGNGTPPTGTGLTGAANAFAFAAETFTGAAGAYVGRGVALQIGRANYFINGITSVDVNAANSSQRSQVTSLVVNFAGQVSAVANPAGITVAGWTGAVATSVALAADGLSATITFTGGTDTYTLASPFNGSSVALRDGRYQLQIAPGTFTSAFAGGFDNTGLGSDGGTRAFNFHRFFGDTDGDADVDFTDRNIFNAMLDNNNENGEGTGDGVINSFDDTYFPYLDYTNDNNVDRTPTGAGPAGPDYANVILNNALPNRRRLAAGAPGSGVPTSYLNGGPRI
jgi:hypothetical protein